MQVVVALVLVVLRRYAETQAAYRVVLAREWARDVAWKQYWRRAKEYAPQRREAARERFRAMLESGSCTNFARTA